MPWRDLLTAAGDARLPAEAAKSELLTELASTPFSSCLCLRGPERDGVARAGTRRSVGLSVLVDDVAWSGVAAALQADSRSPVCQRHWGELSLCECFLTISQQWSGLFEHGSVRRDRAHASCIATRLVAGCNAMWLLSSSGQVTCLSGTLGRALSLRVISDHISAVALSFRARIGALGPCTCQLHSYEASGRLQCNVATPTFRKVLLSVRDTGASSLCE